MAISTYHNGIGGSTGDSLTTTSPLMVSGDVWYVSSGTGVDSSTIGKNREAPLATLAQAVTNAADDDIIVFLDGHSETLTVAQSITKRLTLIGEGSSAGVPTVTFNRNSANENLWTLSATNIQVRNIKFSADAQSNSAARLVTSAAKPTFIGCYFQATSTSSSDVVRLDTGTTHPTFTDCTWISSGTTAAPCKGMSSTGALADLTMKGCVFSAGSAGWGSGASIYALDLSGGACTRMVVENLSLLLGADARFHASSTGYVNVSTCTGGSKVVW